MKATDLKLFVLVSYLVLALNLATSHSLADEDQQAPKLSTLESEGIPQNPKDGLNEIFEIQTSSQRGIAASAFLAHDTPVLTKEYVDGDDNTLALLFSWNLARTEAVCEMSRAILNGEDIRGVVILRGKVGKDFLALVSSRISAELPARWASLMSTYQIVASGQIGLSSQSLSEQLALNAKLYGATKYKMLFDGDLASKFKLDDKTLVDIRGADLHKSDNIFTILKPGERTLVLSSTPLGNCDAYLMDHSGVIIWSRRCKPWTLLEIGGSFRYADALIIDKREEAVIFSATEAGFGVDVLDLKTGYSKWDFHAFYPSPFERAPER